MLTPDQQKVLEAFNAITRDLWGHLGEGEGADASMVPFIAEELGLDESSSALLVTSLGSVIGANEFPPQVLAASALLFGARLAASKEEAK